MSRYNYILEKNELHQRRGIPNLANPESKKKLQITKIKSKIIIR